MFFGQKIKHGNKYMMKKLTAILFLNILFASNANAGYGSGELILSDNVVYNFQRYLQGKQGAPMRFLVTEDGKNSFWWYCPYSKCASGGDTQEAKKCTARHGVSCQTFAVRRSIKWKNGTDARALKIKFKSKDSIQEIKDKLTALNFYGSSNVQKSKPKTSNYINKKTKQKNKNSSDIVSQLEDLNKLFKSGALTKEEFETAKKKLLN